jgi:hypothetical protein
MEHPLLQSSGPATKKEAWWWLNSNAAYRDVVVAVGTGARARTIRLKRGQLTHSLRFLGKAWGWDHVTVSRFLNTLRNSGWLDLEPDAATGQTLITICDYGEFSRASRSGETADETPVETAPATASETKKKESNPSGFLKKGKNARFARETRAREDAAVVDANFDEWWELYPNKVRVPAARVAYRDALARASPGELLDGLRRYIAGNTPQTRQWLNPDNWLKQQRWLDPPVPQQPSLLIPLNGGRSNERRRQSPVENLYEGALRAAETFERRQRGGGADS